MSIELTTKKAQSSDHHAQAELSLAYFTGNGIEKDLVLGEEWFEKAAEDRNSIDSVFSVDKLAKHPDSCSRVTWMWKSLRPYIEGDKLITNTYLMVAAEGGDSHSQHNFAIACFHEPAHAIPPQYQGAQHAINWHLQSLENGHPEAHRYLAMCYSEAEKPETLDYEKSFYHLSQIVDNGNVNETKAFGRAYVNGDGVKKNMIEGVKWLFISGCQSNLRHLAVIENAVAEMSEDDYQVARAAAIGWIKANAYTAKQFRIEGGLVDPIAREALDITFDNAPEAKLDTYPDEHNRYAEELTPKWHAYVTGAEEVSVDEINTLLMEGASIEQLHDIFKHYDCKDELVARYMMARQPGVMDTDIEAIAKAARADLLFKYNICTESEHADRYEDVTDELSEELIQKSVVRLVDESEFNKNRAYVFYEVILELISDELDEYKVPGIWGLKDILLNALQDDDLKHHVLCAFLAKKDWNFNAYLDVIRMGAEYDLNGSELLIKIDPRRKIVA